MRALLCIVAGLFVGVAHAVQQANPDIPIQVDGQVATVPVQLAVGFGTSVPGEFNNPGYVDKKGPSRSNGGEKITVVFRQPKNLSLVRLASYSRGKVGRVLVRKAQAQVIDADGFIVNTPLTDLYVFNATKHAPELNYQGLVILPVGTAVSVAPNQTTVRLDFTVEGFNDNDATLLLQLVSADGFAVEDFLITRTGPSESGPIGGFFDESGYADFTYTQRRGLMLNGRTPSIPRLDGTSWVCSAYPFRGAKNLDFKTRNYFSPGPGRLQSTSDLSPAPVNWVLTEFGWRLGLGDIQTYCGNIASSFNLRVSRGGGLILEQVVDRAGLRALCRARGYSDTAIDNFFRDVTFPSAVNSTRWVGLAHEYCRPASI